MVHARRDRLSGVVEVDEAFIGGARSGKRGCGAAGKGLVMVAAEADGKKIGIIRMGRDAVFGVFQTKVIKSSPSL